MRLSSRLQNVIQKAIVNSFGISTVYLFGSRVNDKKSGGDIDLAIDVNISQLEFKQKKIEFISNMLRYGFDLKIDLVMYNQNDSLFADEIKNNSIKIF